MVISRRLLCGSGLRFRVLGLDGREDLSNPCKPFHSLELLLAVEQHHTQPMLETSPPSKPGYLLSFFFNLPRSR